MTVEQIAIRQEIRQMLNEVGINKNTLKGLVKDVLEEAVERACTQALHERDIDAVVRNKIDNRFSQIVRDATKLIKNYEKEIECIKKNRPTSGYKMLKESLDMAISAMEKQIPKKPKDITLNPVLKCKMGNCPNCDEYLNETDEYKYCSKCGQDIDWSDTNG